MEIKNLRKAAQRILRAVKNKEKIILYADSDPDGAGSAIILKETLETLGFPKRLLKVYFPDRDREGYGINETALKFLSKFSPALFIALDSGITNIKEVDMAKKLGFEVMIIDHHEPFPELPKASIIVDPKQKGDKSSFKTFACTAIVYKLAKVLFSLAKSKWQPERFLELVLLATLYDQMPLVKENQKLVDEGILALNYTKRVGLKVLMELTDFKEGRADEIRRKILTILGAGISKDHLNEAYLLLTETSLNKAKKIIEKLKERSRQKAEEIKKIFEEIEKRVSFFAEPVIFEGDSSWQHLYLGAVASKISQKYKKPVFLFKKGKKESRGTVRVPSGFIEGNGFKAMMECSDILKTFGGHPFAGGFRIENKNLEEFRERLIRYFTAFSDRNDAN